MAHPLLIKFISHPGLKLGMAHRSLSKTQASTRHGTWIGGLLGSAQLRSLSQLAPRARQACRHVHAKQHGVYPAGVERSG
jgi:hypothetical protein